MEKYIESRIEYIDTIKGIGIILVLLGHTYSNVNCITIWLNSFHMPLFFIITGYLIRYKEDKVGNRILISKNKIKKLLFPYFSFGILLSLYYSILSLISEGLFLSKFNSMLLDILSLKGIGPLWFLPCLFLSESIFTILIKNITYKNKTYMITLILFFIGILSRNNNDIYLNIRRVFIATGFISFGYILYKTCIFKKMSLITIISINILNFFIGNYNGMVGLVNLEFNNIYIYIMSSILGSLGIISLFKRLECLNLKTIKYIGQNSIIILCTQSLINNIVRLLDYKLFNNILPKLGLIEGIVFTLIILIISIPIIKIINFKFPILIGKIKEQNTSDRISYNR